MRACTSMRRRECSDASCNQPPRTEGGVQHRHRNEAASKVDGRDEDILKGDIEVGEDGEDGQRLQCRFEGGKQKRGRWHTLAEDLARRRQRPQPPLRQRLTAAKKEAHVSPKGSCLRLERIMNGRNAKMRPAMRDATVLPYMLGLRLQWMQQREGSKQRR